MSLNYASYNFNSIVQQLRDKLKEKNPVWDNYESSTATMLIELFAYIGEMLMYTAERRAQESYLPTAQLKSSIINLVRLINYRPRRKVSSTGKLTFTIAVAIANNIYIPKYTRCSRSDGAVFLTAADTILFAGSTSVEVDGIQGDIVPLSFISDGTESQEYAIVDDSVENSNLVVTISNAVWTEVSSFVESQSSSLHYRIFVNNDETVSLRFGDNKFGKIPPANVSVGIQYVRSLGGDGNVFSTGVITNILDTIEDELGNVVTLTVTNSTVFLGGDDAETIEEIRYNAPRIFATAERDVTKQDYISDLGNYPSVAAVNVWGEAEENPPNQDMMNKLKIVMLLDDWNLPGTNFKQQISDYLQTRAQVTVQYEFVDPDVVELNAVVKATTTQNNSLATVENAIRNALASDLALGNVNIGVPIRYSDVVQTIEGVSGVLYSYLVLQLKQNIGLGDGSTLSFSDTLQLPRVKDSSVQLYKNGVLIGFSSSADGSTAEVDKSQYSNIVTLNGVIISTKYFKFGTGSFKFNGINAYASMPDHPSFNLSSGVWTYRVQIRPDLLQLGTLYYHQNDNNNYFCIYTTANGAAGIRIVSGGVTAVELVTDDNLIVVNEWTHLEFSENGNTYNIFVNGSPEATTSNANRPVNYSSQVELGRDNAFGHYFSGYMDEAELTKDLQRNSVNFSAPTAPYAADSNTSLLLHMNGFGNIIPVSSSGVTGTIDYSYGIINIAFNTAPIANDVIHLTYEQKENELDLIPSKQQIIRLVSSSVTVSYES